MLPALLLLLFFFGAACEHCFGAAGALEQHTTESIGLAMLMLLVLTTAVCGSLGAFFVNVRRRARRLQPGDAAVDRPDAFHLPDAPAR